VEGRHRLHLQQVWSRVYDRQQEVVDVVPQRFGSGLQLRVLILQVCAEGEGRGGEGRKGEEGGWEEKERKDIFA